MRRIFCGFLIAGLSLCAPASFAAEGDRNALTFSLPVLPELQRHFYLLENPAYLVLVLENNGMGLSLSSKPVLRGRTGFSIRNLTVQFSGKSDSVYRYAATLKLSVAGVETEINVPAEVDVSGADSGSVVVKAYPPMAGIIPQVLLERVDFKLKLIADLARQGEILRYLENLPQRLPAAGPLDARLEAILTEAYNRSTVVVVPARDNGGATPLSEQIALILTIAIWLIAVPVVMVLRYRRNMRKLRTQGGDVRRE